MADIESKTLQFNRIRSSTTLGEEIMKQIENEIANQNLAPGEQLPTEHELSQMFGVSRTSVREAIQMLSARGLVNIKKGRGTYVSELSSEPMLAAMRIFLARKYDDEWALSIMKVRQLIEPYCAKKAAENASESDIKILEDIIAGFASANRDDFEKKGELERNFHLQIAKMSGNPVIPLLMQPIFESMPFIKAHIYEVVDMPKDLPYKKHKLIYRAIRDKKPDEAQKIMAQHIHEGVDESEGILDKE